MPVWKTCHTAQHIPGLSYEVLLLEFLPADGIFPGVSVALECGDQGIIMLVNYAPMLYQTLKFDGIYLLCFVLA